MGFASSQCSNRLKEQEEEVEGEERRMFDKRRTKCASLDMQLEQLLRFRHNFHNMYTVYL